jgi:predicted transcriptional regulator
MANITEKKDAWAFSDEKMQALFGSKTRVKLLKIFLANPDDAYYVRELTRLVDMQINAIRRELKNLIDLGIINVNEQKNLEKDIEKIKSGKVIHSGITGVEKKYYQVNKEFVLFNELKSLFAKMKGISKDTFLKNIQELGDITILMLSGLFIKDPTAEVDLLVVGDVNRADLQELIDEYNESVAREINYTLLSVKEFLYRQEVVDRFLYNLLQNSRNKFIIDKRKEIGVQVEK